MQTKLIVNGMDCNHCVSAVKKALMGVSGVTEVNVDLAAKTVDIAHGNVAVDVLKSVIEEVGFDVEY